MQGATLAQTLDSLDQHMAAVTATWAPALETIATSLLFALLGISLVIRFGALLFQAQDLGAYILELIKVVAIGGFWLAAIDYAPQVADVVIDSFVGAAQQAQNATTDLRAGSILAQGMALTSVLIAEAGIAETVLVGLLCAVVVVIFAAISAYMLIVLAETYIVTAGGIVLMGFGGLSWTEDIGRRYIVYVLSVGAKLMALHLTVGFALGLVNALTGLNPDLGVIPRTLMLLAAAGIALLLVQSIPGMVQGIVNGSSIGMGTGAIMTMGSMVGQVAGRVAAQTATTSVKSAMGARAATGAAVAGMGATSVREAVAKAGGGVGGVARVGGAATRTASQALAAAFGQQLSPQGTMLSELKGARAAAEALRDAPPDAGGGAKSE